MTDHGIVCETSVCRANDDSQPERGAKGEHAYLWGRTHASQPVKTVSIEHFIDLHGTSCRRNIVILLELRAHSNSVSSFKVY